MISAQILDYGSALISGVIAVAGLFTAGRSLPRWAFAAGMGILAVESLILGLGAGSLSSDDIIRWQKFRLLILSAVPGIWLIFSATYARGERTAIAGWKAWGMAVFLCSIVGATWWLRDQLVLSAEQTQWGTHWHIRLSAPGNLLWLVVLICSVWIVVNLERTFRASVGTTRWRIKYMLLGAGVIFVVRIYTSSQAVLFRGIDSSLDILGSIALLLGSLLMLRSVFRTGHFNLEVYPSRSVLQKSLTVLLAGTYLLIVGVLAKFVTLLGGDVGFAAKAFLLLIAVVLLAVVIQSDRARLELRKFVSRNFRRSSFDYRAVWKTFTDGTASRVEQTDLCRGLVRLTADVFDALSVAIVLIDDRHDILYVAASTATPSQSSADKKAIASTCLSHFKSNPVPVDLDKSNDEWAVSLKQLHPSQFSNGGHRICAPLIGHGDVIGVLLVGDRVGGAAFSLEDFDMLKCIADHAAASILNVHLSTRLVQAKELEAFQAMAAFFVHDLKNAASTLNLMLQNLPIHYDNPEFREDALRGISKTVGHINRLIGRLGMLRHELKVDAAEADINEVVQSVLNGLEQSPKFVLTKEIQPVPTIRIDRDQIHKVVTNLILNATEAVPTQGQIRVGTSHENGWIVLTVADNGCGMSEDFLSSSLFRPFQTTKKTGLGIGMFQSKMIIEAHRGKITVTSAVGKGTTFRVFLPRLSPS